MDIHSSDKNDNCTQNIKVKGYRTRKDYYIISQNTPKGVSIMT
jgi:hypothetical protein